MIKTIFDPRLTALAECPVLNVEEELAEENKKRKPDDRQKHAGGITFNPHPAIQATSDLVLTHELCHRLAGKRDYDVFLTSIIVRGRNTLFKWVLNALYDWYHENKYRETSVLISTNLMLLRQEHQIENKEKDPALDVLLHLLNNEIAIEEGEELLEHKVRDVIDLVVIADKLSAEIKSAPCQACNVLAGSRPGNCVAGGNDTGTGAGGNRNNGKPVLSSYYFLAVSKYYSIITTLAQMWSRNKYGWQKSYYGEINWCNLPLLLLGNEIGLPVFRLMSKIDIDRRVFLVVDRSGSTSGIRDMLMDTSIIITESLRMLGVSVSVMDVGVTDTVINKITEPIILRWFTPKSDGSTPLGRVIKLIEGDDSQSLLIIITDGCPDSWSELMEGLFQFKGDYVSFVIGNSYKEYQQRIKNVIPVEPNTIIRSLIGYHDKNFSNS
ncbi:MAG TPA: hypothetical protein VI911_02420 [Patescibacteria group bacterium]|nr:hypothetical protein [Patescibacteria group bacterium]